MRLVRVVHEEDELNQAVVNLRPGRSPAIIICAFGRYWKVRIVPRDSDVRHLSWLARWTRLQFRTWPTRFDPGMWVIDP